MPLGQPKKKKNTEQVEEGGKTDQTSQSEWMGKWEVGNFFFNEVTFIHSCTCDLTNLLS